MSPPNVVSLHPATEPDDMGAVATMAADALHAARTDREVLNALEMKLDAHIAQDAKAHKSLATKLNLVYWLAMLKPTLQFAAIAALGGCAAELLYRLLHH
jgi:hypothetical protein